MINLDILVRRVFFLGIILFCARPLADVTPISTEFNCQKFIELASIRSISEVETAKIALQKSSSPLVQAYAQSMITEGITTLNTLRNLANDSHLYMLTDAELQTKARKYIFKRKGKTFDAAYADMRVSERRKMVSLFREAINSNDVLFKHYAGIALPSLMRGLYLAQHLVEQIDSNPTLLANK